MSKIGLALGGGGAKGFAHIGVIRALEEMNIRAEIITGTSMGGLLGAMYAAGLSADRIEAIVRSTGLTILAAREPSRLGLFGKSKIKRVLQDVLGDVTFDRLDRKLAMVAVDLESEAEVILDSGRVVDAVLATTAFPGVFAPQVLGGRYLIDGGALNNVPFDVARQMGADWVIASNVSAHRGPVFQNPLLTGSGAESWVRQLLLRSGAMTPWEVVERTLAIMLDGRLQDKLAACPPDVMLCPEVGHVGLFDVGQLDSCLAAGRAAVRAHEAELAGLRDRAAQPPSLYSAPPLSLWMRLRDWIRGKRG
jgi:NTE family protein